MTTKAKTRHGGPRPGAGRPAKEPVYSRAAALRTADPVAWLTAAMIADELDLKLRLDAAKALASLQARMGKKELRQQAAFDAVKGSRWEGLIL
ncbi:MAG: hypothetical protein K8F62_16075 [Pseudorhodoplanes sp.]|nr:hypothetical protein [Pseudorhodoplanes sp.]MCC7488052.1 hypothetical protein [Gammaproteobacteria bacterium]CAG0941880.1 hypothetical protein GPROT2_01482 [Gammaproteobacteria bacterium]